MKVSHMVCLSCARMHGQEHVEGCPAGFPPGSWLGDYIEGWDCARTALLPPLADRIRELEEAATEVLALEWPQRDYRENHPSPRVAAAWAKLEEVLR